MEIAAEQDRRQFLGALLTVAGTGAVLDAPAASAVSREANVNVYERIGVEPLINAAGILTILGGSLMLKEVKEAMEEASRHYVNLRELHEAAGARIAKQIGVEAALVTSGAAAALLVGTAACVTKGDPERIHRLPDTTGLPNEVIVQRTHRHNFDHAMTAPTRNSADYYTFNLADAVWGGGFQTRINLNLRENKGYSYGVFSIPRFYAKAGVWPTFGGVQTDKTKESIVEFKLELKNIAGPKPITEKELADAKANRVRGYAQEFETMGQLVGQIAQLWTLGLPMTELQRFPDETGRATLAAVNQAAQKYAVPGQATLLLVGDYSKIGPGLGELNLGEITILDAEGKPAKR
ncbi:MAG: insulinase family protein [Blastocatellia bacterium]